MKNENAIEVRNVKKRFKVYFDKGRSIKEKVLFRNRNRYEIRWVLNGVSFDIKKGEAVGLIGQNGCGKSTTLKLLTRIIYPNEGSIEMCGRVSSLIELGAGFHPDMSGRENIYTNASIFGLTRKEIDDRIQDIIEFSEMEEFLDNPVRTYSSGMYMRLAFSVAINVDADILLIDEILAVGDANFQAKCLNKLREIKAKGTTIIIVSHSLNQIEQICDRCVWLKDGLIYKDDAPYNVTYQYLEYMGEHNKSFQKTTNEIVDKSNSIQNDEHVEQPDEDQVEDQIEDQDEDQFEHQIEDQVEDQVVEQDSNPLSAQKPEENQSSIRKKEDFIAVIDEVELLHSDGRSDNRFKTGEQVTLKIGYSARPELLDHPVIGLKLYRNDNINSFGTNTQNERIQVTLQKKGHILCKFDKFNLIAGEYILDIAIRSHEMFAYDYKSHAISFVIYNSIYEEGIAHLDHSWEFN
jgi:ABC-2 type transport system ATP-binding protein